jgi:GT2 family glycosyltransferase/peptidoglycan/xylan/chitin deacetylase (PgdA/CDA1 family)
VLRTARPETVLEMLSGSATASVVVPTYNRRHSLSRTLPPLFSQSFPAERYEIVVVDDGSTDGTSAFLGELRPSCGLRVVTKANGGLASARNAGVRAARGDLIIFIDDDIDCGSTLVAEHVRAHDGAGDCVMLGPTLIAAKAPISLVGEQEAAWRRQWFEGLDQQRQPRWPVEFWVGHNTSIPRELFLTHGGYEESFLKFEEYELGFRLRKSGVRFRWQPAAVTYHVNTKSVKEVLGEDSRLMGKNEFILCRKYPEFRPYARLARLAQGGLCKRMLREGAVRSPISPTLLLRTPLQAVERLSGGRRGPLRYIASRLLDMSAVVLAGRGARDEAGSWEALRTTFAMRVPALLYHRVGPPVSNSYPGLSISVRRFERQMRWLIDRGYAAIAPSDWLAWRIEGKSLPPKPILITFDDAYADTAEYAFPILKRYGLRAATYVVTGYIGATNVWDQARGYAPLKLMSAEEIKRWCNEGIEFGSHSRSHPDLTAIGAEKFQEEIAGSVEDLQRIIGVRPASFAYPHGRCNPAVRDFAQTVYAAAFTAEGGMNDLASDPVMLHRTVVASRGWEVEFKWQARAGHLPMESLRVRMHLRSRTIAMAQRLRTS